MSFILGTSRLTYDFFGNWTRTPDGASEAPEAMLGDAHWPGSAQPGTFAPCGAITPIRLDLDSVPEA